MAANAKKAEAQAAKDAVKAKEQEKKDAAAWAVGASSRARSTSMDWPAPIVFVGQHRLESK